MSKTPWAVLLCKFNDRPDEPHPKSFYEKLFTEAGIGTQNMLDYFHENSHGTLDLRGSQVFGWLTLDQNRADYVGSGANQQGRQDLVDWAKQKAKAAGVDLSRFFGFVVSLNVPTDLFGQLGGDTAVCDLDSLEPSLLGQEMGHVYGLDHSRLEGSTADYMDPYDIMSTWSPFQAPHPAYGQIGPALNAANMESRSWLDQSRVWTAGAIAGAVVQLRPHLRRDLSGFLAARVGEFLVEFRVKTGWDAGIPAPVVLVHRFEDGHSYLMPGTVGQAALAKGGVFERGSASNVFARHIRIEVLDIDPEGQVATLGIAHRVPDRPPVEGPVVVSPGVMADGGGFVIVNGRIIKVPPRSPLLAILENVAVVNESALIAEPALRGRVRQSAFAGIARLANAELGTLGTLRQPQKPPQRSL
jgi:hypothetical protein